MTRAAAAAFVACLLAGSACGARTSLELPLEEGASATGGKSSSGGSKASGGNGAPGGATTTAGVAGMPVPVDDAGTPALCGNGVLEPGEECDLGPQNASSAALVMRQGELEQPLIPIVGPAAFDAFYAYSSASSHTGYEELGASSILLYRTLFDPALALVMHHGIDSDSGGVLQPRSSVYFYISVPTTATVGVSDEPKELHAISSTEIVGDWTFNGNSDGGVIIGLSFPGDWSIVVSPSFLFGIDRWNFRGGMTPIPLDLATGVEITARSSSPACRLDCTIPRCGDGVLDAGEVCEDGMPLDAEPCSACRPF